MGKIRIRDKHPGSATLLGQFMDILECPLSFGFFIWLMMPLGVHPAGQEGAGRVRIRVRGARPHLLQELLQRALSAQEVRHGRHSGLLLRGHGELGPRHLQVRGLVPICKVAKDPDLRKFETFKIRSGFNS
jgi:hypothetical protein